jgi:hypothetical protein
MVLPSQTRSSAANRGEGLEAGHQGSSDPPRIVLAYSGIHWPRNQKPHPFPSPASTGNTCWPIQLKGWWSKRPWSTPRPCQSTGPGPRSSRWSPHAGVPGRSHPQGSALAVPRPTPNRPATPIPAARADADNARLKDILSLRFSSMRQSLPRGVTLCSGHGMALWWRCVRAVQGVTS